MTQRHNGLITIALAEDDVRREQSRVSIASPIARCLAISSAKLMRSSACV
jgi:hypothetical protein